MRHAKASSQTTDRTFTRHEDAAATLGTWLAALTADLRADMGLVLTRTPSGDFEVLAACGAAPIPVHRERLPGDAGSVCGFSARQVGAVIFDDVTGTARFSDALIATHYGAVSSLVVSLRVRGEVVGVLGVHSRTRRSFTGSDARALEQAADACAGQFAALLSPPAGEP